MRTLSSAAQTAMAARVTRPIYLVEIAFAPVSRLSTAGDVTWNSLAWSGAQWVEVSGLSSDGSGVQRAQLAIGNVDLVFGSLVLGQGVADRAVTIWGGDAAALATGDPVLVFVGAIASAEVSEQRVTLALSSIGARTQFSPRRFINASAGFNTLIAAGTQIRMGTQTYILERR